MNPWDRQPNESRQAYTYFHDFYLSLDPNERSLNRAYQNFLKQKHPLQTRYKPATGTWVNYFRGLNANGKRIIKLTWSQRADAYDHFVREQRQRELEQLRIKHRARELEASNGLFDRAQEMRKRRLDRFRESDIPLASKTASDLGRRALEMPDSQKQIDKNLNVKVEAKKRIRKTVRIITGKAAEKFFQEYESLETEAPQVADSNPVSVE